MSGEVYNIPGEEQNMGMCCESAGPQAEGKFIRATVEAVVEALDIGWKDRRIVQSLLEKALENKLDCRYKESGLLQQYEAYVLETAAGRLRERFDIPKDVKVNHNHATHAKYADIVDWIDAHYSQSELKKGEVPENK